MKLRRILSLVLVFAVLTVSLGMSAFAADTAQDGIQVVVAAGGESKPIAFTEETGVPFQDASYRTMVPLRAAADAMGLTVEWNQQALQATFTAKSETVTEQVVFTQDSSVYLYSRTETGKEPVEEQRTMDTVVVERGNRFYAPIRYLAESFGWQVFWFEDTKTVTLTKDTDLYADARPILLQGAMDIETEDMIAALENPQTVDIDHYHFVRGMYKGYPVVVSRTEQGVANAAATTALAMQHFNPIAVINQGTAGGHDPELNRGDIVIGDVTVNYSAWKSVPSAKGEGVDYQALEKNGVYAYDKNEKTFVKAVEYPGDPDLLAAANAVRGSYTNGKVVNGVISTCDGWNNQVDRMLFLHEFYGSSCEEMEANAVAQVCKTYDVPYVSIRILSNSGLHEGQDFDPATGPACQNFVLAVTEQYIKTRLHTAAPQDAAAAVAVEYGSEQRPLLLQGAMDIETSTMIEALENPTEYTIGQWYFVSGTYHGYPVVVSRTEQGVANAGASTALAIEYFNPIAVINQGTSGGHDPALHTGDIVLGERTVSSAAMKTTASAAGAGVDYKAFEMIGVSAYDPKTGTFVKQAFYEGDDKLLAAAEKAAKDVTDRQIVRGTISTSDEWNNQIDRMLYLNEVNGSSCEEMESNAVAQLCKTYDIPFLAIRILSNTGIYGENFDPATGPACQNFVLAAAANYIDTVLK